MFPSPFKIKLGAMATVRNTIEIVLKKQMPLQAEILSTVGKILALSKAPTTRL